MRCLFSWKWILPLTVLVYLYVYTVQNICPQYAFNLKTSSISSTSPTAWLCLYHENVFVPTYSTYVLPVVGSNGPVAQKWHELDSKFKISETIGPKIDLLLTALTQFNRDYVEPTVSHWSRQLVIFYYGQVAPRLQDLALWSNHKYVDAKVASVKWYYSSFVPVASKCSIQLKAWYKVNSFKAKTYFDAFCVRASIYYKIASNYVLVQWNIFVDKYVAEDVRELCGAISQYVHRAYIEVVRIFEILRQKTHDFTTEHKNNFVKSEFKNLLRFNDFKKSLNSTLLDFTHKFLKLEGSFEDIDSVKEGSAENRASDNDESDYGDSDEEPIHSTIVKTIVVTKSDSDIVPSGAAADEVAHVNEIDNEVFFWTEKISKTLQLASQNLIADMTPKGDAVMALVKGEILELLQKIQVSNHNQYKLLNVMIADIHKDYEAIIESGNKTVIESVSREKVREEFQRTYNETEISSGKIQNLLIEAHSKILEEYYETVQGTIDIIQLFAENTLQDYLNYLNNLPADLDETYSWGLWKSFYQSKENIYKFRDDLFNQFNAYKEQPKKADTPIGLEKWAEYLRNIEFTLNYLIRDNSEYLRLARARANLAFQLREELTYKIESAEEEIRQAEEKIIEEVVEDADDELSEPENIPDVESVIEESSTESAASENTSFEESSAEEVESVEELSVSEESATEEVSEEVFETAAEGSETEEVSEEVFETATVGSDTEEISSEYIASEGSSTEDFPESEVEGSVIEESADESVVEVPSSPESPESVTDESVVEVPSSPESVTDESFTESLPESETEGTETEEISQSEYEGESEEPFVEVSQPVEAAEVKEPAVESPDASEPDTQDPDLEEEVPEL